MRTSLDMALSFEAVVRARISDRTPRSNARPRAGVPGSRSAGAGRCDPRATRKEILDMSPQPDPISTGTDPTVTRVAGALQSQPVPQRPTPTGVPATSRTALPDR